MSKKIVRILCLVLALLMAFSVVGCKKKNTASFDDEDGEFEVDWSKGKGVETVDQSVANKNTKVVEAAVADADSLSWNQLAAQIPANLKGKTITVYSWNPAKEVTGAEKVIANFTKQTGIKVNWVTGGYEDYDQKVAAMINAGNSPDIIRYQHACIHRMALCQDIKSATGYACDGAIWDSRITPLYTVKGKVYGVNLKNTLVQQPFSIQYRQSLIEELGFEDPYVLWKNGQWTYEKMIDMCKAYKELYPNNRTPLMAYDHTDIIRMAETDLITFDGNKFTNNVKSPELFKALKEMCTLKKNGVTSSAMRHISFYEDGLVLFMFFNSISARVTNANMSNVKKEDDHYMVPLPDMGSWSPNADTTVLAEEEAYGVPKGAKNGECVYYFLRYYLNADNYDENTFFVNSQALEAFKSMMSKSRFTANLSGSLLDVVDGGPGMAGLSDWIRQGGEAAQLQQELDTINPIVELATKKANEALANFK